MRIRKIIRPLIFLNKLVVIKLTIVFFDYGTIVKSLFKNIRFSILSEYHNFYHEIVNLRSVSII